MSEPMILFENIYEDGTITSDSEAAGFPDDNVTDWRRSTGYRWKANDTTSPTWVTVDLGAGVTATPDTIAIGGHNLSSAAARYKVQGSSDNFVADTVDMFSEVTPSTDDDIMKVFQGQAKRYWRIYIDKAAGSFSEAPQIGVLTLGRRIEFEGLKPNLDPYGEDPVTDWHMNDNGALVGSNLRHIRKTFQLAYGDAGMTVDDFFDPAVGLTWDDDAQPHLRNNPCWFAWNLELDATGVWLCWRVSPIQMPHVDSTKRRELHLTLSASIPQ